MSAVPFISQLHQKSSAWRLKWKDSSFHKWNLLRDRLHLGSRMELPTNGDRKKHLDHELNTWLYFNNLYQHQVNKKKGWWKQSRGCTVNFAKDGSGSFTNKHGNNIDHTLLIICIRIYTGRTKVFICLVNLHSI